MRMERSTTNSHRLIGLAAKPCSPTKHCRSINKSRAPRPRPANLPVRKQKSRHPEQRATSRSELFGRLADLEYLVRLDIPKYLNGSTGPANFDSLTLLQLSRSEVHGCR